MQRNSFDDEILRTSQAPPYREAAEALCCLRGVKTPMAMTLLSEIDDIRRFRSPGALMAYFGLVPSVQAFVSTRDTRERQLRTNTCECGTQPANISLMIVGEPLSSRPERGEGPAVPTPLQN